MLRMRTLSVILVVTALILRVVVTWVRFDSLSEDRDAYLAIAQNVADGNGFASVPDGPPTAFRPPLYPAVLAVLLRYGGGPRAIAILHVVLGTATVGLTLFLGHLLRLGWTRYLAAVFVAIDPLLLGHTAIVMTETLFTFLATSLICAVCVICVDSKASQLEEKSDRGRCRIEIFTGVLFGLCALCRPTIWAYAVLAACWYCLSTLVAGNKKTSSRWWSCCRRVPWRAGVAACLVLSPWVVRNIIVFGHPIATTTHGGYTLLLGNNPVFYREVVAQPWGTVWSGESLSAWQQSLEDSIATTVPAVTGERDRDRWMYERAKKNIVNAPGLFVRACWLRFLRFWSFAPLGSTKDTIPPLAHTGITLFYSLITVLLLFALCRLPRPEWQRWMPLILLIASFTLVHLVYWTNMRMRAPLVPAISLLAARALLGRTWPFTKTTK